MVMSRSTAVVFTCKFAEELPTFPYFYLVHLTYFRDSCPSRLSMDQINYRSQSYDWIAQAVYVITVSCIVSACG